MTSAYADSANFPVSEPTPILAFSPVSLDVPGRPVPLELKVTVPARGTQLPVILFAHGHGMTNFASSLRGYGPLVDFWAAHGFVVIQPTHLDSTVLGLRDKQLPDAPIFWRSRAEDMHFILDHLEQVEGAVPGLAGRIDCSRVAAAGHSLGGHTVSLLLGMQVLDPNDSRDKDLSDARIKAGVVIAGPGVGDDLAPWAVDHYPVMKHINFDQMSGNALVIAGDKDLNPRFSDRLSYRWDAYSRSPGGNKTLLTFVGGEHMLGGISGYDCAETTDENPERVAALRALVWAYLRSQLYPGDRSWDDSIATLRERRLLATVESR